MGIFAIKMMRPQVAPVIYLVWGIWLYLIVVIGAIALEVFMLRANTKPMEP